MWRGGVKNYLPQIVLEKSDDKSRIFILLLRVEQITLNAPFTNTFSSFSALQNLSLLFTARSTCHLPAQSVIIMCIKISFKNQLENTSRHAKMSNFKKECPKERKVRNGKEAWVASSPSTLLQTDVKADPLWNQGKVLDSTTSLQG